MTSLVGETEWLVGTLVGALTTRERGLEPRWWVVLEPRSRGSEDLGDTDLEGGAEDPSLDLQAKCNYPLTKCLGSNI